MKRCVTALVIAAAAAAKLLQSCPTLSHPMDCSLPGSSVPGIFQARVLEWGAIAFSVDKVMSFANKDSFYFFLSNMDTFPPNCPG